MTAPAPARKCPWGIPEECAFGICNITGCCEYDLRMADERDERGAEEWPSSEEDRRLDDPRTGQADELNRKLS